MFLKILTFCKTGKTGKTGDAGKKNATGRFTSYAKKCHFNVSDKKQTPIEKSIFHANDDVVVVVDVVVVMDVEVVVLSTLFGVVIVLAAVVE